MGPEQADDAPHVYRLGSSLPFASIKVDKRTPNRGSPLDLLGGESRFQQSTDQLDSEGSPQAEAWLSWLEDPMLVSHSIRSR